MNNKIEYVTDFKDQFFYDKETDCISAEISSLGMGFAKDLVFTITSEKTGKSVDFHYASTDFYGGSEEEAPEVGGWNFKATDPSIKTTLLIIND